MRNRKASGEHSRTIILAIIMVLCLSTAAQAKYSGGTGEPNDPYLIATAEDMNAIGADSNDWDAHFLLVADINLADYTDTQFNIIGNWDNPFAGVFDENNHTISNFIYTTNCGPIGLFCCVGEDGQIKNIGMEDIDVNSENNSFVGGLVGVNFSGTISNCYATGIISGWEHVGGLVGGNGGTISNSYAAVSVTATGDYIGGLAGDNGGTISNSYAISSVSGWSSTGGLVGINVGTVSDCNAIGSTSGYCNVGGLVGENGYHDYNGTITNCSANSSVSGNECIGGLVGGNQENGTITNCYADGSVSGNEYVGGLVGGNGYEYYYGGTISDCHAIGNVDGNDCTGGLVGRNWSGTISNCYATGNISGDGGTGGLVGANGYCDDCNVTITNCYATGNVDGNDYTGGLVGINCGWDINSTISCCYATGAVNGNDYVGGLVGQNENYNSIISCCYATGSVTGENWVGGLVGYFSTEWLHYECVIIRCYSTGSVTGENHVGGLAGDGRNYCVCYSFWDIETSGQTTSAGGTGKTTAKMKTASTYFGWSGCGNEGIWTINDGNDYPHLTWEGKPGQPIPHISDFFEGSGTQDDPYQVSTAEQLNLIGLFTCERDKHFILMNDVNLEGFAGTQFNIIGYYGCFSGVFDGNGKRIWNFTWDSNSVSYNIGLFGCVTGQIKNLGLENVDVNAVNGYYVGGLVGENFYGTIINCYSTGSVTSEYCVGGLVAYNCGTITNCYSSGRIDGNDVVGGLVGLNLCEIENCYFSGSVDGNEDIGGLVGYNSYDGMITNCYSIGSVTGSYYVGGLVGEDWLGTITNCYSTGSVSGGECVGGLVGFNDSGVVTASFWDIDVGGPDNGIGTPLSTEQMQTESTFTDAGWDFVCETENGADEVWTIKEGVDYPRLLWECFEDYQEWLAVGKPPCWCCPRQCHGDVDNTAEYIKGKGYYHVHYADLDLLVAGWSVLEPPDGPGIAWPDPNICADFDHDTEYIKGEGHYSVHFKDLNILLANWNVPEPPDGPGIEPNCLDCP